ncbi:N-acetylneuraminate synthase family protein [Nitrosopumilus sp.]|uniref:N-acetylneuraminate synthase family protein n=1 Tax=Nitrosopumilus sp. TaxID=2024843 RepID=UPI00247ECCCF|nr:N-acetylneuraminate synthase family protein [Nitrosopumilus sp.]MCV0430381.1 N-acetylneuraminate synthase family protein [Nitrosopumilus sp.]
MFSNKNCFVIAEIANSHEGSIENAIRLIKESKKANADAVKFQIILAEELATSKHKNFKLYKKLQFSNPEWQKISKISKKLGLKIFADVFGLKSAKIAVKIKVDGFKIHSSEIGNKKLIDYLSKQKKNILISAAGSKIIEIEKIISILASPNKEIALLHGFQGYPTKLEDLNLKRLSVLKNKFRMEIGIMDHVSGDSEFALIAPLLAVSLGATIVEKHITLNRDEKGIDYFSALNPIEFKKMVKLIKNSHKALGNGTVEILGNELQYRLLHKKTLIAKKDIPKYKILSEQYFDIKRAPKVTEILSFYDLDGKIAAKKITKGTIITSKHLEIKSPKVVAVIACRINSDRLFAKPLQKIGNEPILKHIIKQIKKSSLINEIVLAISEKNGNQVFEEFARENNLKFVIGDETDVLSRLIKASNYTNADIVFRCTSENPFLYWEKIDNIIKEHISGNFDYTYIPKIPLGCGFELINKKALEISHKNGLKKHRSELCTLYINENQKKFKILPYMPPKELQKPGIRLTVDTPEDLQLARIIFDSIGAKRLIRIKDIISFLEKNQELTNLNSDVKVEYRRYDNV